MEFLKKYQHILIPALEDIRFPNEPANLYQPLAYFLALGGKRMRPLLTLMSCKLFDKDPQEALSAALSVELFHNFSLIHDDIMDEAPLRRGKPTVHEKWNSNIAILSGDVLLVKAYEKLSDYEPDTFKALFNTFNTTAVEVCEGQQMDMDFESRNDVSIEEYTEMIRLKTSVLLGAALKMGAQVAGADTKNQELIYDFGVNMGIAFQLQDDWLDLYADPEKFGKQVGGDVIANKKTFLLLGAQELATNSHQSALNELLTINNPMEKVNLAKSLFSELGVESKIRAKMNDYYRAAKESLSKIEVAEDKKADLIQLGDYLLNREV